MFIFTVGDIAAVVIILLIMLYGIFSVIAKSWKEWHCEHNEGVTETSACDAICRKCNKNLGFIGTWRERVIKHPLNNKIPL